MISLRGHNEFLVVFSPPQFLFESCFQRNQNRKKNTSSIDHSRHYFNLLHFINHQLLYHYLTKQCLEAKGVLQRDQRGLPRLTRETALVAPRRKRSKREIMSLNRTRVKNPQSAI
jgi:hypothetical protein